MHTGLHVESRHLEVEFALHGQSREGTLPLIDMARRGGLCLALMGRLTYRDALRSTLPASHAASAEASDVELALAAYEARGEQGLTALEGDFALVLWDPRRRVLIGSRDPMGGFPLYWAEAPGRVALSTDLSPLLDLLPSRRLNRDYLAEYLMLPALGVGEVQGEACVYEGVHRVGAGSLVRIQVPEGRVETHRFWDWRARAEDPGTDDLAELATLFSERLRPAIHERVRGRTAAHLSGGMDSTAVALVALEALRAKGGDMPLHALSIVHERHALLAREQEYLDAALAGREGIRAHRIPGDHFLDYDSFAKPPHLDEPSPGLLCMDVNQTMVDVAARHGADTILTGMGGDDVSEVLPHHIADLLRRGRIRAAWKEAGRWGAATNDSAWHYFRRFGLSHLVPFGLRSGLSAWIHRGEVGWDEQGPGTIAPWIRHDFAKTHDLYGRGIRNLRRWYGSSRPVGKSLLLAAAGAYAGDANRRYLGAPRGILITHPFLDPRVITLALGFQSRLRPPPGEMKPLLARALGDVIPEKIRQRRRKGHGNELYYAGLTKHRVQLENLIADAPVDDLGMLDKMTLMKCLRQTALGVVRSAGGTIRLDVTLSLLKWLSMQEAAPLAVPPTLSIRLSADAGTAPAIRAPLRPIDSAAA